MLPNPHLAFSPSRRLWLMRASGGAERPLSPRQALGAAEGAGRGSDEVLCAILRAIAIHAAASPTTTEDARDDLPTLAFELSRALTLEDRLQIGNRLRVVQHQLDADTDPLAGEVSDLTDAVDAWCQQS